MKSKDYVEFIINQMHRRPIDKEKQIEIRHDLTDMIRNGLIATDIQFLIDVKYGSLFKSNCIEY